MASDGSDLLNVGGEGGEERSFDGDLCSSPEELVPSDWVSEPKIDIRTMKFYGWWQLNDFNQIK